jgi:hypothetical protein
VSDGGACYGLTSFFRNIVSPTYVDLPLGWRDGFAVHVLSRTGEGFIAREDTCSGVFGASIEGGSRYELQDELQSRKLTATTNKSTQ